MFNGEYNMDLLTYANFPACISTRPFYNMACLIDVNTDND